MVGLPAPNMCVCGCVSVCVYVCVSMCVLECGQYKQFVRMWSTLAIRSNVVFINNSLECGLYK